MGDQAPSSSRHRSGQILAAAVASRGAIRNAPRELMLYVSGSKTAVRHHTGELVWLQTEELTAFPADGRLQIVRADGPTVLIPADMAAEVSALRDIQTVCAWFDAHVDTSPPRASEHLGRRCHLHRIVTSDGRTAEVKVDRETGLVLSVHGKSLRGDFSIEVTSLSTGVDPRTLVAK